MGGSNYTNCSTLTQYGEMHWFYNIENKLNEIWKICFQNYKIKPLRPRLTSRTKDWQKWVLVRSAWTCVFRDDILKMVESLKQLTNLTVHAREWVANESDLHWYSSPGKRIETISQWREVQFGLTCRCTDTDNDYVLFVFKFWLSYNFLFLDPSCYNKYEFKNTLISLVKEINNT